MFTKNKIVLALGLTGFILGNCANAAIIGVELEGDVALESGSLSLSANESDPTTLDLTRSLSEDAAFSQGNAKANDSGWFYITAFAQSNAQAISTLTQTYTFENDGDDGFFDFNFVVENGSLSADCIGDGYGYGNGAIGEFNEGFETQAIIGIGCEDDNGSAAAGYAAQIAIDGAVQFESTALLTLDTGMHSLQKTGIDLNSGSSPTDGFYNWGEQAFTIDLGFIAANDIVEIVYTVITSASGDEFGTSYAQFNDPFSINQPGTSITRNPMTVSAPSTALFIGLSLFGFAAYRIKNR